jgi:phosphorylase kinase alpha/beta subunit
LDFVPHRVGKAEGVRSRRRRDADVDPRVVVPSAGPPLQVSGPVADQILRDVDRYLKSDCGIRRYLGDSYWAPDYDQRLAAQDLTRDFSGDIETRDKLLDRIGQEAEWCIFDSMLSACYGRRNRRSRSLEDLERQCVHLERALAQITGAWQCPELYYMKQGIYVANPNTPLLWAQANLMMAFAELSQNVA